MMLLVVLSLFIITFHEGSALQCYQCELDPINYWINNDQLPSFPINCKLVEAEKQCSSTIRWLSLEDGKKSLVQYGGDVSPDYIPKNSSLSYVFIAIAHTPRLGSDRFLLYSCTTDKCNNRTSLLQAFKSLILEENFARLDVLFHNTSYSFTEQSTCHNFSNSTHLDCPPMADPLILCANCLLLSIESPSEICARCPADTGDFHDATTRQVYFFLENRTRLADTITLQCTKKACNSLDNWRWIHQLSILEYNFGKFDLSSTAIIIFPTFFLFLINFFLTFFDNFS